MNQHVRGFWDDREAVADRQDRERIWKQHSDEAQAVPSLNYRGRIMDWQGERDFELTRGADPERNKTPGYRKCQHHHDLDNYNFARFDAEKILVGEELIPLELSTLLQQPRGKNKSSSMT
jgi:hypothetical protein